MQKRVEYSPEVDALVITLGDNPQDMGRASATTL